MDARDGALAGIARLITQIPLWGPGAPLVVAVSGGADSLCLLGALLDLRERRHPYAPGDLTVATFDHRLRGVEGEADIAWVAALAASLGLRCVAGVGDAHAFARERHLSLEDAARRLRYRFLRRVASEVNADRIAVAHTQDDQAETILLRLVRGAGLTGLAGMRPLRGDIARPLLTTTRAQTEAYCASRGWAPREDATNHDERFLRNRVRHRLLPVLESFNPRIRSALARMAGMLADDEEALDAATDQAWSQINAIQSPGKVTLDTASLSEQPRGLRRRLIRRAVAKLLATEQPNEAGETPTTRLEEHHIALIERLAESGATGTTLQLPSGVRATRTYTALLLNLAGNQGASSGDTPPGQERVWPLVSPGMVEAADLGWRVRAVISEAPPGLEIGLLPPEPNLPPPGQAGAAGALPRGGWRAYADADVAGARLSVRAWRAGDRFRPLGMAHVRKLQDVFTDAKIPRDLRRRLPLVCAGEGADERILWVAGLRIGDEFKLTSATRRTLVLQAEPVSDEGNPFEAGAMRQEERDRR